MRAIEPHAQARASLRFKLDNHNTFNHGIDSIATVKHDLFVSHWQQNLPLNPQTRLSHLVTRTLLVSRFEKSWSQMPVDLNRATDNPFGDLVNSLRLRVLRFIFISSAECSTVFFLP
jgi:hypothetical protein